MSERQHGLNFNQEANKSNAVLENKLDAAASNAGDAVVQETNFVSAFQSKPRRQSVVFPQDCTNTIPAGEKNRHLQTACAKALASVKTDLQKAAEEGECSRPVSDENNNSYVVVDDEIIRAYTIKNSDETNISIITQKLETVIESLIKNNDLDFPIELKINQELKYQKAHYVYDFEPTFYPLSPNKYLVEVRCDNGAYNQTNIYLIYDESKIPAEARVLEFPYLMLKYPSNLDDYDEKDDVPDSIEKITVKTIGGRYFNRKTKELIVFVKAHGIGDAGRYARYSFLNDKPKLKEFRARIIWSGRDYQVPDVIKSPPQTWKRYYPK